MTPAARLLAQAVVAVLPPAAGVGGSDGPGEQALSRFCRVRT